MIVFRHCPIRFAVPALAAFLSACAGADLTLPEDATPTHIDVVTGDAQAGIAGNALTLPLVVRITDDLGRPVSGQLVEYTVHVGGGQMAPASVQTDAEGRASSVWTLGTAAGAQEVEARAVGGGAADNLAVTFTATAVAGSGSLLTAVGGDDQHASVNSVLPESLVVRASDVSGNPVSGVTVQWSVQGGGSISPGTVVTGGDGRAAAQRVLGGTAGQQTAQATADGLAGSPVTFAQTALASSPSALKEISGNNQTAPAGFEVAEDLVVQVTDANGNGIGGRPVTWVVATGGGAVSPANSSTDPNGFARTRWTLGTSVGSNTLNAVLSGLSPMPFAATASADVPSKLTLVSGDNQLGVVGQPLANPLVVKVTDANDNPVENVSVAWTADGRGSVSSATSATDPTGVAQVTRTLGSVPSTYLTTAAVTGIVGGPLTFTSTATVGPPAKVAISTQPGGTVQNGALLSPQPVVQVQDALGNNVGSAAHSVTAELLSPPAGASLGGAVTKPTNAGGTAAFTDLRITGPVGPYTLRFTSGALTQASSSQITLRAGAVSAAQSTLSANPTTVSAGVASTITVTARDASGNPVSGATVVLAASGIGNTLGQPSGTTGASGQITGTFSSTAVGSHVVSATINGTAISASATITVTAGAVSAGQSTVTAAPVSVASGTASTVTVTARDASGNPVPGATVVLLATGIGNTLGQPGATTSASGVATGTFSSTGLGVHTITATINGTAITDNPTVTVTPGAVSASQSTVTAAPDPIQVGGAPSTVTVTARDASGNPVPGASVTLAVTGNGNTVSPPGPTNSGGVSTATFTSTQVGAHVISATINGVGITDNATVTVTAGPVSASQSTVDANPNTIASGASSSVTVTARDGSGNPIQGATVVLLATGIGNTLGQPGATTSASGVATGTFSSTGLGVHTITATINGTAITDNATVTVTPGAVSASQSTVTAAPDPIQVGGAPSTVTVTARDASGNPVPGASVTLAVTGNGNTVSPPGPTNSGGVSTATFTSTQVGAHVISATINGVGITDNATVTVTAGPVSASQSTVDANPNTIASGASSSVTVTARDGSGNPIQGATVVLLATGIGNTLGQPGATNGSGVATGTFSSTGLGPHTISASINGTTISDNSVVTVTSAPVSAALSTVNASPGQITAGGAGATVTITARDADGNPVAGATVALTASGTGNSFSAHGPTNGSGVTTATYTSTEAGDHLITATINGTAITDNATVTVQAAAAATLTFTVQPTTTQANQPIDPPVVVAVEDQFGNPTSGTVVMSLVVPPPASGLLSGTLSVAAAGGRATFSDLSVDDPSFLPYRLTATLGGISVNSSGFFITP